MSALKLELSSLLSLAKEAIVVWSSDGRVVEWNEAAADMLGYKSQEILGQPITTVWPAASKQLTSINSRLRRGELLRNFQSQWNAKGGKIVDISLNMSAIFDDLGDASSTLCCAVDISYQRQLAMAERSELFLNAIISSAEDAIITTGADGRVRNWNPGAEQLFGYSRDEMIGNAISVLVPEHLSGEEAQILERILNGHRSENCETQRIRKDGRILGVSLAVSPIKDTMGQLIGVSYIARDISSRKRLEEAERDQLFLGSIVSSAEDAIVSKDLNGIVTSWNKAAEKIFGYNSEEMVGQPITKIIPPDHFEEEPQILQRIRRGERIQHYESKRMRKDGTIIDVSLTISPIKDRMGQITGASKIARDITEKKQWQRAEAAESFLGALVDSAEDAIISIDLDGIVTSWNAAAESLYGYAASEIMGTPIARLIPPDHPDEGPRILDRIRQGERITHFETKRVRRDGSPVDISLTVSPIKDSLGRIVGASKIARDITEQKRAQAREHEVLRQAETARREAEQARQEAEAASRAKDDFLATISHELRTPLTSIVGWTRMLASGQVEPERRQKVFEIIDRNARAQAQLIEDLLDVSRIISGKLRVDFKIVDLPTIAASAVEALRPSAEAKSIRIGLSVGSGVGPILGAPDRLQQVVWNLLSNAIKFTPPNGSVQIELRRVKSQVEIRVSDTGVGISPAFLPRVFDRFSQSDSTLTRSRGGLGLGLAIVKAIVEFHGGVVSASSPGEGKGAVFTVSLPIRTVPDDSRRPSAEEAKREPQLKPCHGLVGLKILVVDDEPDTCEMLRFIFDQCGSIVKTAESANNALGLLDKWHPDILISDIAMPNIDGYELIRIIREERKSQIPAVALTAMARIDDRVKALTAGYQMHASKPVEPAELLTIVSSLVELVNREPECN
jgi:hypothetical protein